MCFTPSESAPDVINRHQGTLFVIHTLHVGTFIPNHHELLALKLEA